jgi:hypothetical protein
MKNSVCIVDKCRIALVQAVVTIQLARAARGANWIIHPRRAGKQLGLAALLVGSFLLISGSGCVSHRQQASERPWNSPDFMDRNRHSGDPGLEGRGFWNTPGNRQSDLW